MQEVHYKDGRIERDFLTGDEVTLRDRMADRAAELLRRSDVTQVKTKMVPLNRKCPCGSGKKFKKCCLSKAREVQ